MPRMTNTYMLAGDSDPADIVRSVKKGLLHDVQGGRRYHQRQLRFLGDGKLPD
jgi:predicted Zn-dependent protease